MKILLKGLLAQSGLHGFIVNYYICYLYLVFATAKRASFGGAHFL
jgi:hypothetical protein